MGMVAPLPQIASAYFVVYGQYGDVSRYAAERGVCRQWVYREADWLRNSLATSREKIDALEQRVRELEQLPQSRHACIVRCATELITREKQVNI